MTNGKKSSKQGIINTIFLSIGILVVFLFLALLIKGGQVWIATYLTTYTVEFNIIMAILLFIFGLLMILNIDMVIFYRLPAILRTNLSFSSENSFISSFYLGLSYTAIAAPCAAPIFLSLISLIILLEPLAITSLIVLYAIGASFPFLIIGITIPHIKYNLNKQFNQVARLIKPISGTILILMSIFLLNAYYFPYYPLKIGETTFRGLGEYFLFEIYVIILGLPLIVLLLYISVLYLKKIYYEKKKTLLRNID